MRNLSEKADKIDFVKNSALRARLGYPKSGFLGIPSGIVIFLMIGAVIFSFGAVLFKVLVSEQEAAKWEIRSVSRVFENHKQNLLEEMERYAASNAAYQNIETNLSMDWIENRFGVDMALDFKHDYTALIGKDQKVLFASGLYGKKHESYYDGKIRERIAETAGKIRRNYVESLIASDGQVRFAGRLKDVSGVDVIEIDGRPTIVCAFAIVPDPGGIPMTSAPPNILVTAFEVDAIHLNNLLARLSLDNLTFVREVPEDMIAVPLQSKSGHLR